MKHYDRMDVYIRIIYEWLLTDNNAWAECSKRKDGAVAVSLKSKGSEAFRTNSSIFFYLYPRNPYTGRFEQ